jgi:hypothetical protein
MPILIINSDTGNADQTCNGAGDRKTLRRLEQWAETIKLRCTWDQCKFLHMG